MYFWMQTILALLGIFSWVTSSSKIQRKEDINLATPKVYTQVSGNGWCSDQQGNNEEGTARRFEQVNCADAKSDCDSDSHCIAYACVTGSDPMSVLYTTTNCQKGCGSSGVEWQTNPRLITQARSTSDQPAWSTATCHVAYPEPVCSSAGYMNSSTAILAAADAWSHQPALSAEDCESKCSNTQGCVTWKGNASNWNFCYTASTYTRSAAAWPAGYTGKLKCANPAVCGSFVASNKSLGDPSDSSGSPWVLLPATSRENCAAQCEYDKTCVAYKGGDDTNCLLTPNVDCKDFTCYVTLTYSFTNDSWETTGPDWAGSHRSGCD